MLNKINHLTRAWFLVIMSISSALKNIGNYLASFFYTRLLESNTNQDIVYGLEILNTSNDASNFGTTIRSENSNHV